MNIAFFGTSDRSLPILKVLNQHFNLVFCITKTDTKIGRAQKLEVPKVKIWADQNNIDCLKINSVKKQEQQITKELTTRKVDLGIVADFGFIITKPIIDTPKFGLINVHFSLLPKYRGASPIQFALLKGDQKTGITYYLMDDKLDTGSIIYQSEYKIKGDETSGELYAILFDKVAQELPKVITDYTQESLTHTTQNHSKASYTYSDSHPQSTYIFKEDAKINWQEPFSIIEKQVRAYNPWPISWTTLGELETGLNLKIKPSKDKGLKVKIHQAQLQQGKLIPEKIQVEGKKIMTWKEFANGYLDKTSS